MADLEYLLLKYLHSTYSYIKNSDQVIFRGICLTCFILKSQLKFKARKINKGLKADVKLVTFLANSEGPNLFPLASSLDIYYKKETSTLLLRNINIHTS